MAFEEETKRIREAYAGREAKGKDSLYQWYLNDVQLSRYRTQSTIARTLRELGISDLSTLEILDVGCGRGGWLLTLLEWGAIPERVHGTELLQDRIEFAKSRSPNIDWRLTEGPELPFDDQSMDMVFAHLVFSTILDPSTRQSLAGEMCRVLKTGRAIVIYDQQISDPRNPDTLGIRLGEIQRFFPEAVITRRTLTLAPPIARRIAPLSALLAHALEICAPFLRTHALYVVRPRGAGVSA